MVPPWLVAAVVVGVVGVGLASFVPIPSLLGCNVVVNVGITEVSVVVGTYFSISSVNAQTTGGSTLLNWGAIFSFAPPAIVGAYTLTATIAGHTGSRNGNQLVPSIPVLNGGSLTASDTVNVGNVPLGQQNIAVTLTQNGQTVATGSGAIGVSC